MTALPATRAHASLTWPVVALSAVVVAVTAHLALGSERGQRWDNDAMLHLASAPASSRTLAAFLGNITVGTTAVALVICLGSALVRGRWDLAIAAVSVVVLANVTTQVLKHVVLHRDNLGLGVLNSLPSGHTTVVASIALAGMIVVPRVLRPIAVALGTFAVTLVGASTIVATWHRPADVITALAVCVACGGLSLTVLTPSSEPGRRPFWPMSLAGAGAAGVVLVIVGVRPTGGWEGLPDAAAVLIVVGLACSLAISTFAALLSRQP